MKASDSLTEADLLESQLGDKDEFAKSSRLVERIGSVLVGVILLAGLLLVSITAPVVVPVGAYFRFVFREVGDAETPWYTIACIFLQQHHLQQLIGLVIAGYGYWLLRTIPDRRRANLYAGVVSLALLAFGNMVLFSSVVLLMKMFSVIGNYAE